MTYLTDLLIAGELRPGRGGPRDVENPADESVLAQVNDADEQDVEEAVGAASRAWRAWARTPEPERAAALRRLADLLAEHREELAEILVAEVGKPVVEAEAEIGGTIGFTSHAASLLETRTDEIRYTGNRNEEIWTRRRPYGVVAAIIPWNFPSALVTRKLAPALAAGNAVVLKADEKTPLSALAIARIVAGSDLFPPGLVNVLTGAGESVGRALVRSSATDLVTMTGSSAAGKAILADAADQVKPVSLELGGKAPFIVMPDADLDLAVRDAVASRHMNCGQVCIANERTFVHESLYQSFVERYVDAVSNLVVADPRDRATQIGPKVSGAELDKTLDSLQRSVSAGAKVLVGGSRLGGHGYEKGHWFAPTVVGDVTDAMPVMSEELFGPVTPVTVFDEWDEVAARANATRYGLSAYVYTSDLSVAMAASRDLSFGEVYINRIGPEEVNGFHAGFHESGLGGDDGAHGLDGYFRKQTVYMRY
ncbi:aldehyde dehydrogenase family protein [Actinopolymorpha pittospori]|uniref:Lactaldehyde dehydrogenase/glycolaldehyde dehydrogenase n=1 Tax=Actinopolymorpha pittospori TaxID=648752 RepID=A0A927N3X9_9ACTN|nr:aldehyde dehydrogenase family protein [Actinopolymorpha pittospori]MBE1608502.1 lactaldehyde dehydrogenase/glycolaldehyde dehydrogenase [Actinopolymorpha pittospori]